MDHSLAPFLAISIVVIVTPGQDTALTIRKTLLGGRPAGVATAIGVASGQFVWTIAASVGITAVLVTSGPVFAAVRLGGGIYLTYLGATTLWSALRGSVPHRAGVVSSGRSWRLSRRQALRQGLLSNLGNPKMVVFFTSLLPQVAPTDGPAFVTLLGLGLLFCSLTLLWLTAYASLVARAGVVLQRPRVRRVLDAVTGAILVAFGLRLATEST
jgi:threonine/homoserine/homoserine lactone efflux protein